MKGKDGTVLNYDKESEDGSSTEKENEDNKKTKKKTKKK